MMSNHFPSLHRQMGAIFQVATFGFFAVAVAQIIFTGNASAKGSVEKRSYYFEKAAEEIEYALYVPSTYSKETNHPLVVVLHDRGSNPHKVIQYKGITASAEARGYIVVAPFGYNKRGWYGSRGKSKKGRYFGKPEDPENLGELSELDVLNVLEIVQKDFSIDDARIYLMGHAMGGGGTLHLAITYPQMWAGLAPLAPSFFAQPAVLEQSKHIPTIIVTGDDDEHLSVDKVRKMVAQLEKMETKHRYIEIKDGDHYHSIAENPAMIAEVFDFFDGKFAGEDKSSGEVYRNFTNSEGKTIQAHLVSATDNNVTVKRMNDGKQFTLPITALCQEDQTYLKNWIKNDTEKKSIAAFEKAIDAEPDPELEAKLIAQLKIDRDDPESAIKVLSNAIVTKEKEINTLDGKVIVALRGGNENTGRQLQIEAIAINEELIVLRSLQTELKRNDNENTR